MAGDEARTGQADLLQPLAPGQRILALDVVRGFALFGILLMNIEFFTRPLQGIALGMDPGLEGIDFAAGWAVMAFVQGKFWTLFSLLFGAGFAVMLERSPALDGFAARYARRLAVLLLIGLAHALLLWAGDILVPYALAGFLLLLLFRGTPVPRLWKWGVALYAVPPLLMWVMAGAVEMARLDAAAGEQALAELAAGATALRADYAAAASVYADGSYAEATRQRWADFRMMAAWLPMMLPAVLGMFLVGAWCIRSGVLRTPAAHARFFRRWLLLGLPGGVLLALLAMPMLVGEDLTMPTARLALGTTLMSAASLLLCLAYLSALVLATLAGARVASWLAPVGRMALSNYLLQSLCFSLLFYGYGLGLWGQVPRAWQLVLALGFFLAQVLLSRWWLRRFRFGPVECLWRALTYLRAPALRG